jgi:hypothetical protein
VSCGSTSEGTGSSGGIPTDEYSADERRDLVEVIDWLATQDWSSGGVGMFGTSYGGFNSLAGRPRDAARVSGDRADLRVRRRVQRRRPLLRRRA